MVRGPGGLSRRRYRTYRQPFLTRFQVSIRWRGQPGNSCKRYVSPTSRLSFSNLGNTEGLNESNGVCSFSVPVDRCLRSQSGTWMIREGEVQSCQTSPWFDLSETRRTEMGVGNPVVVVPPGLTVAMVYPADERTERRFLGPPSLDRYVVFQIT